MHTILSSVIKSHAFQLYYPQYTLSLCETYLQYTYNPSVSYFVPFPVIRLAVANTVMPMFR